jgi:hypothetical protein
MSPFEKGGFKNQQSEGIFGKRYKRVAKLVQIEILLVP